jgi:hypothetical protein
MLSTSAGFKPKINAAQRTIKALVVMHFRSDVVVVKAATASSQLNADTSPDQACNGRVGPATYAGTGNVPAAMQEAQVGWWSAALAEEGVLPQEEMLTVEYTETISIQNIWWLSQIGLFPTAFVVEARISGDWIEIYNATTHGTPRWGICLDTPLQGDALRIRISKVKGGQLMLQEFGVIDSVFFEDDDIVDFSVLEEVSDSNYNPMGNVTSNECSLSLSDLGGWLVTGSIQSPFKSLLKPKVPFDVYVGVEITPDVVEFVPLGKFKSGDWKGNASSLSVSLSGYDRLQEICNIPMPVVPVVGNTTISSLLRTLFTSLEMDPSEYTIDPSITLPVRLGWLVGPTVGDALRSITIAGLCNISMDRTDRIAVRSNFQNSDAVVAILTDDDQILSVENPQRLLDTHSAVKVNYSLPSVGDKTEILKIADLVIPVGGITLERLAFKSAPVGEVTVVKLLGAKTSTLTDFHYGAYSATLVIANTGTEETVTVVLEGTPITTTVSSYTEKDQPAIDSWGESVVSIESPLIQYLPSAQIYARSVLKMVQDPTAYFDVEFRGDPTIELMDVIRIQSTSDNVNDEKIVPIRIKIDYSGTISATINGRKPIILS